MVKGFLGSAVMAEIKYKDRYDLGLIYSEANATVAANFTTNVFKAAPVTDAIEIIKNNKHIKAILVNSGNANACTGLIGLKNVAKCREAVAKNFSIDSREVLMSSTGVIGAHLPVEKIVNKIPELKERLSPAGLFDVAKAIMTTDTFAKTAQKKFAINGNEVTVFGIAKGAGMIAPKLSSPHATMLAFIMTDANIEQVFLQNIVNILCNKTFNKITVDGDTSTNDSVIVLANGIAANSLITNKENGKEFIEALDAVMKELSYKIVKDGEGATKFINIKIKGMNTPDNAAIIARTIAESPLVKTAIFGEDPNWGRILAAAGRAGVNFNPDKVNVFFDDVMMVKDGMGIIENEEKAKDVMKNKEYSITVAFDEGAASCKFYTCDYSFDYIKINADYRS